jgi:peptidoglycan LD-endopeptidase LytH
MRLRTSLTVAAALAVATAAGAVAPVGAATIAEARDEANEAAAELARAQSRQAELEREIDSLESRRTDAEQRLRALTGTIEEIAVKEFVSGGTVSPVLLDADIHRLARANALAEVVAGDVGNAVDEYRAAADDLARTDDELRRAREEAEAAVADVRRRADAASAELRRMEDEAAAARRTRAAAAAGSSGSSGGAVVLGGDGSGWLCPVQGPRSFTNDWGMPRSGGRRHQGNDILSPRGTPVVASVSGTVRTHNSSLGGLSYYLTGDDGNTYFGTHLNSYSGASGRVERGTVLGYVGDSGNARGGPTHLHFEIHPGGGSPINPYPTVAANC